MCLNDLDDELIWVGFVDSIAPLTFSMPSEGMSLSPESSCLSNLF